GFIYNGILGGGAAGLAPLKMSFLDYVRLERESITERKLSASVDYWKDKLRGSSAELDLERASRRESKALQSPPVSFLIPLSLRMALWNLARTNGATLFNVLFAAFSVLLHKHSGQEDFLIAAPASNR